MVKVTYQPWNEIVIHEIIQYEIDELCRHIVIQALTTGQAGITPQLLWLDGVAFGIGHFPDTEAVIEDKLKGVIHYALIEFALVPEYRDQLNVSLPGGTYKVKFHQPKRNPFLQAVAQFLKQQASME